MQPALPRTRSRTAEQLEQQSSGSSSPATSLTTSDAEGETTDSDEDGVEEARAMASPAAGSMGELTKTVEDLGKSLKKRLDALDKL
eukprot:2947322-Rhodomonas_salina.1